VFEKFAKKHWSWVFLGVLLSKFGIFIQWLSGNGGW